MGPVTTAILSALVASNYTDVNQDSEQSIQAAYQELKDVILNRLGENNSVNKAIDLLETAPEDLTFQQTLEKVIQRSRARKDEAIFHAAQQVLIQFQHAPQGEQIISNIGNRSSWLL